MQALAYDVPIPGFQTKNTISLRLWEAKACAEDFNLFLFNDGQHESASVLHSRAQQVGTSDIPLHFKNKLAVVMGMIDEQPFSVYKLQKLVLLAKDLVSIARVKCIKR